jgi:hypothetical protein
LPRVPNKIGKGSLCNHSNNCQARKRPDDLFSVEEKDKPGNKTTVAKQAAAVHELTGFTNRILFLSRK